MITVMCTHRNATGEGVRAPVRARGAERPARLLPLQGVQGGLRRPREAESGPRIRRSGALLHGHKGRGGGARFHGWVRQRGGIMRHSFTYLYTPIITTHKYLLCCECTAVVLCKGAGLRLSPATVRGWGSSLRPRL